MRRRFLDGDSIERDPREEDPLVYYVPAGDWARAVGVEVDLSCEAERASEIASRVWSAHVSRLENLDDVPLERFVSRLVQVLSDEHPASTMWRAEWPSSVVERIGSAGLRSAFEAAGWRPVPVADGSTVWAR